MKTTIQMNSAATADLSSQKKYEGDVLSTPGETPSELYDQKLVFDSEPLLKPLPPGIAPLPPGEPWQKQRFFSADLTGDGKADLLIVDESSIEFWGAGQQGDAPLRQVFNGYTSRILGVADLNNDGISEYVMQKADGTVGYFNPLTGQQFTQIGRTTDGEVAGFGKVTSDDTTDIVWRTQNGTIGLWLNGTDNWQTIGQTSDEWQIEAVANISGNSNDDIVFRNVQTNEVGIWLDGTSQWQVLGQGGADWELVGTGDFEGNNVNTLVWTNRKTNEVGVWDCSNGAPVWKLLGQAETPQISTQQGEGTNPLRRSGWSIIGISDINGDGRDDLLWRHDTTNVIGAWNGGDSMKWQILGTDNVNLPTVSATF